MEEQKPGVNHYNPVTVTIAPEDTVGAALLGVLSIILLVALLISQRRVRNLQKELDETRHPVLIEE
ncbi:MAG: hypothetical protein R2873_09895 [Caldilineaceae bacterium]